MKLTRRIIVKLYTPDNKKLLHKLIIKAPQGNVFTELGVKVQLDHLSARLDENIPGHRYKLYPKTKEEFRFYWDNNAPLTQDELKEFYTHLTFLNNVEPKNAELESTNDGQQV